ncbi:MAG: MBL fold metallo-hydrolase [Eubacteriales bacterium]
MNQLIVLGTGNALATECYNTCYLIEEQGEHIMVDAGGGNGILVQMKRGNIDFASVRHLIITHEHSDHVLGVVWVFRKIATMMKKGQYEGEFHMWCHEELAVMIRQLLEMTLQQKFIRLIGERILIHPVVDGEQANLLWNKVTFFDIHSTKAKQFAFTIEDSEKKVVFLGDEPYNELCEPYVGNAKWLLCEAFCLYEERDIFEPYEKHHVTVKEACELAEKMKVANLVLWHTEDKNYHNRKELYGREGAYYYSGNLLIPNDLEIISL